MKTSHLGGIHKEYWLEELSNFLVVYNVKQKNIWNF